MVWFCVDKSRKVLSGALIFREEAFSAMMTNKDDFSWVVCGNKRDFMADKINNLLRCILS